MKLEDLSEFELGLLNAFRALPSAEQKKLTSIPRSEFKARFELVSRIMNYPEEELKPLVNFAEAMSKELRKQKSV